MSDLSTLRAEIKAWERSFKEENGSPPMVEDIKKNGPIAEKYKQYKKLTKAAIASSSTAIVLKNVPPSTPPRTMRHKEPESVLLSRTRVSAVQPSAPLAGFNPFSPKKRQKGKEREKEKISINVPQEARSKPFANKVQPIPRTQRKTFSPDPFPAVQQSRASSSASSSSFSLYLPPEPTSAVSRARKRLRGEPVSPSPNKEKRRRVVLQTTLPFPRLNLDAPSSDEDEGPPEADSSFVDNSPVKAPSAGKLFPSLFEENLVPMDLFGVKGNLGVMNVEAEGLRQKSSNNYGRLKPVRRPAVSKVAANVALVDVEMETTINRTISRLPPRPTDTKGTDAKIEIASNRSSSKRSLSDDEGDQSNQHFRPRAKSPLLPPSPPPSGNTTSYNKAGKNKAKAKRGAKGRKKAKVGDEKLDDNDSDEVESTMKLRIVGRNDMRSQHAAARLDDDDVTSDLEPVLGYPRFAEPRGSSHNDAQQEDGDVDIDLPDKLRSVLALQSAASKVRVSEEDRLVKGLLYGRRLTHYDPNKGGEIWDVGEDNHVDGNEEVNRYTEGEDDWEGEPVPWEAAEL